MYFIGGSSTSTPDVKSSGSCSSTSSVASDRLSPPRYTNTLNETDSTLINDLQFELTTFYPTESRKSSESSSNLDDPPLCEEHRLVKEYFCSDCDREVCVECIKQFHNEHYLYPCMSYPELLEETERVRKSVQENVSLLEQQINYLQYRKVAALNQIRMFFARLREVINVREQELMADAEYVTEVRARLLDQKMKDHHHAISSSLQAMDQLNQCIQTGKPDFILQARRHSKFNLEVLRGLQRNGSCAEDDVVFLKPDDTLLQAIKELGAISNMASNMNPVIRAPMNRMPTPPLALPSSRINAYQPFGQMSVMPMPAFTNDAISPSLVGAMTDNFSQMNMFPVSFHTNRNYCRIKKPVTVFGREGSNDGELCRPWGVTCDNNGHVIVADRSNNRIQIFRQDGTFVRKFGQQGVEPGEFNRPAGVAMDYYGQIVVTDKDNHRIQMFTMEGAFVFTFGERGQGNGKFHYPWDVDVNSSGIIVVSDTRNHRIQLFSGRGQFLKKFGFENASNMWKYFDSPRGVCFTLDNTVIVTDFNNHRLYEIDIEKGPKPVNGDAYKRDCLFRPQGVAMDGDGNILVADCRNNRIQVFSRKGDIVGSFGVAGKEMGQFDRPSGIALTPDGKIVVVDFGNHRIQIF